MLVACPMKETEVGPIPEDWRVVSVDEISVVGRGRVISHREISRSIEPRYPVYSSQTANDGVMGFLDSFDFSGEYITWTTDGANAGTVFYRNGSFNCTNVCGTIKLFADYAPFVAAVLGQYSKSHVTRHVGNPKLMNDVMKRIRIPLPPTRSEQETIAAALSEADAYVASLVQLLAKKRNIRRGTMQALMNGRHRLNAFTTNVGIQHTEIGDIPTDWGVIELRRLIKSPPAYGINAPAVPLDSRLPTYLRITDISDDGRFLHSSKASVDHLMSAAYFLQDGDIVFARTGASVGKSYLYDKHDGDLVFAGFLIRVSPDQKLLDSMYLSYFAQTDQYWEWVRQHSMRSGQPGVNGQQYASVPVPIPPSIDEQRAISSVLFDMDSEIRELQLKLAKARVVKQGMVQQLLTGKIRLI
jgi:restriction endonuclease S subunit